MMLRDIPVRFDAWAHTSQRNRSPISIDWLNLDSVEADDTNVFRHYHDVTWTLFMETTGHQECGKRILFMTP